MSRQPSIPALLRRICVALGKDPNLSLWDAGHEVEQHVDCSSCGAPMKRPCSYNGGTAVFLREPHAPRVRAYVAHVLPGLEEKAAAAAAAEAAEKEKGC